MKIKNIFIGLLIIPAAMLIFGTCQIPVDNDMAAATKDALVFNITGTASDLLTPIAQVAYQVNGSIVLDFGWKVKTEEYGKSQSAYRIVVSSTKKNAEALLGDMWDSEKIYNENCYNIRYNGRALASGKEYYWRVGIWDENAVLMGYSDISTFNTLMLTDSDWGGARWLRGTSVTGENVPSTLFRKPFTVSGSVERARVYISGLGLYYLTVNGQAVDESVLGSSVSQYNETIPYGVHDIAHLLTQGENVIGVELGDGPFSTREGFVNFFYRIRGGIWDDDYWAKWLSRTDDTQRLLLRMDIGYDNNTSQTVVTDNTWRWTDQGPTTSNKFYEGETYNADMELRGWNSPGYTETNVWQNAVYTTAPAGGELQYSYVDPLEVLQEYEAATITKLSDGSWVIAAPEMMSGWMSLKVNAPRLTTITINYGEALQASGGTYPNYYSPIPLNYLPGSVRPAVETGYGANVVFQIDRYTSNGRSGEEYHPKFKYNGFQFVQVYGYPSDSVITKADVKFYRVANSVETISDFSTSSEYVNNLHHLMRVTLFNNFHGRPTDTPIYEKMGYGGDVVGVLPAICFNFDASDFLLHYHDALRDTQNYDGQILNRAPGTDKHVVSGEGIDPAWGSVYIFIAEKLADMYGMQNIVEERYDSMKLAVDWYIKESRDKYGWTWSGSCYGDWLSPMDIDSQSAGSGQKEGSQITSSSHVYFALKTMAKFADQLGKTADAAAFRSAMNNIANAYNNSLWNNTSGYYRTNSHQYFRQTSNYLPLAMGIIPGDRKDRVVQNLLNDMERIGYRIDTGFIGAKYLLPFLSDYGSAGAAFKLLTNDKYPSWGYWVANGATSLWEEFPLHSRSRDHFFWGVYDNWFYEYLAGVKDVKDGFKTFTLKPSISKDLVWVNLKLDTVRGQLISNWEYKGGFTTYKARVPFGSTATIYLPTSTYTVNGKAKAGLTAADGLIFKGTENGFDVFEAGSGYYLFDDF